MPKDSSLKTNLNSKVRQEFLDYDYLNQLTQEEYDWLAAFTHEDNCANFSHGGQKVLPRKKAVKKEMYDKNNARNRDAFGITHAHKRLMYLEGGGPDFLDDFDVNNRDPENSLIQLIDNQKKQTKVDDFERQCRQANKIIEKRKLVRK